MRHIVPDSYRGNPVVYDPKANTYHPTYKKNIAQLAFEAVVTRRLGAYKPFWAKGLDYAIPKGKWVVKGAKTIWVKTPKKKYIALGLDILNRYGKTTKRRNTRCKIRRRPSANDKRNRNHNICTQYRNRQRYSRTSKRNRRRNTYRM